MKKQDLIKILNELPKTKTVSITLPNGCYFCENETVYYCMELAKLTSANPDFTLLIDGEVIKDSFDFALYQNAQHKPQAKKIEYTKEQQEMMLSCNEYQTFLKSQL